MGLKNENNTFFKVLCLLVLLCTLDINVVIAQSNCKLRVAKEPLSEFSTNSSTVVSQQSTFPSQKAWLDINNGAEEDGKHAKVAFTNVATSSFLKFSNFNFNIPMGAKIEGFIVSIKGRKEGSGIVRDCEVRLTTGELKSDNFSTKGYNPMNVFAKSASDKRWKYGYQEKTWGTDWSAAQVNDPSFGLEIQLMNLTNKEVTAFIDDVKIEVQYTQLATFCLTDCFPVYTDPIPGAVTYKWSIPNGFEVISSSDKKNIIDFKVMKAEQKVHNVCVEAFDINGNSIEKCCREIRIRNCTPAKIGDFVWNDINYNGVQDVGEPGISGLKIELLNQNNEVIQSTTTTASGAYKFENITEGLYYLKVTYDDDIYLPTLSTLNANTNSDFGTNDRTKLLFIQFGDDIKNLDFGLVKKLSLGDFVWEDINYNGVQDANESGLSNVIVELRDANDNLIARDTTDTNGKYSFVLPASKYNLKFYAPSTYLHTIKNTSSALTDSDINNDFSTGIINFENTNSNLGIDAGFIRLVSIGDFVWLDENLNGIQDIGESGESGLKIYLRDELSNIVDSTLTSVGGAYLFDSLFPGNYIISIVLPIASIPTQSSNDPLGSDLLMNAVGDYSTAIITLNSGEIKNDIDLGYIIKSSKIGGKVWSDTNANGIYENGEELVSGIFVRLFDTGSNLLQTVITDLEGKYSFDSLIPEQYIVEFTIDDDLQYTLSNVGSDDTDSDVLSAIQFGFTEVIKVLAGDTISNIDAGVVRKSVIGDFVWQDVNYNGLQDADESGLANVTVTLFDENLDLIEEVITDEFGKYMFQNIPAGTYKLSFNKVDGHINTASNNSDILINSDIDTSYQTAFFTLGLGEDNLDLDAGFVPTVEIGNLVWEDLNADGTYTNNELGLANVIIDLINELGEVVASTTTNELGNYIFSNVPAIKYLIKVNLDTNYIPTLLDATSDELDSDLLSDYTSGFVDFTGFSSDLNYDFGVYRKACVGSLTWVDVDENGIYNDTIDRPLADVLVTIKNVGTNDTQAIISTEKGNYKICGLTPGKYVLTFRSSESYIPTTKGSSSIIEDVNGTYTSDTITILSNDNLIDLNAGFLYRPISKICGKAFEDLNGNGILEIDEPSIANVNIYLLDSLQQKVKKIKSNSQGSFCFEKLPVGKYYLKFFIEDKYQFTFANAGNDDEDSDAIGLVDSATTELIMLMENVAVGNIFAGITKRSTIGDYVWFDSDRDGLQQASDVGIPGILVTLCDENSTPIRTASTDGFGFYSFNKVPRGNYFIKFPLNPSFEFVPKDLDPSLGSDVNINGITDLITVSQNVDNFDIDAGYTLKGGIIAGEVWQDNDKDSIRGLGDNMLKDVVVSLFSENGFLISTDTTSISGEYSFYPVLVGKYYLKFDTTTFQSFVPTDGSNPYTDITHTFDRGTTNIIEVTNTSINTGIDAGIVNIKSSIRGFAFDDVNGNSIFDINEKEIGKVKVSILNEDLDIIKSIVTDELSGAYKFDSLFAGTYYIKFDSIMDYKFSDFSENTDTTINSNVNTDGISGIIELPSCKDVSSIVAGYRGLGKVRGEAFVDGNENGLNDESSFTGLNKIEVCLVNLDNEVLYIDTTSLLDLRDGQFNFEQVPSGTYKLKVRRPLYYLFTEKDANTNLNDDIDNDVLSINNFEAYSDPFNIGLKDSITNIDFGLIFRVPKTSDISGNTWIEKEVDGIRNQEDAVEDVVFILYNENLEELKRDTSDINGMYSFNNLTEGFYFVKAELLDEFTSTLLNKGNDTKLDNDFSEHTLPDATKLFYLGIDKDTTFLDLGIAEEANIGNYVWEDLNFDGLQDVNEPGLKNIRIELLNAAGDVVKSTISDSQGGYKFSNIPVGFYNVRFIKPSGYFTTNKEVNVSTLNSKVNENGEIGLTQFNQGFTSDIDAGFVKAGSLGDRVWVDFNANGLQDVGEPGKDSVSVELYKEDGTFVASTITKGELGTGAPGRYSFTNIRPGNYYIKVGIPAVFKATVVNNTNEDINSNIKPDGLSDVFTVLPGENKNNIDAGVYLPGCIGNRVWLDENKNGIQDADEVGVKDVEVKIFRSNGDLIVVGKTNEEGIYLFNDLAQGLYYAEFTAPIGYKFTLLDEGDETTDNDANQTGVTPLISLAHGAKFYDLDAGIYLSTEPNELIGIKANVSPLEKELVQIINPNPAINYVTLTIPFKGGKIEIIDANGKLIESFDMKSYQQQYQVLNYKAGLYYVRASNGNERVTSKFIKVE